jgi:hypothetical protein
MEFKLRDPHMIVLKWAKEYEKLEPKDFQIEEECFLEKRGSTCLDKDMLKRIAHWKSPRSAGHVENNSDEYVKEITCFAFEAKEERSRIEMLTVLSGVEWPTASVILHFLHPDPYPILDFRALWSLNAEVPKQYDFSFWWSYVEACRKLAQQFGVSMRILDQALWAYSKKHQKSL